MNFSEHFLSLTCSRILAVLLVNWECRGEYPAARPGRPNNPGVGQSSPIPTRTRQGPARLPGAVLTDKLPSEPPPFPTRTLQGAARLPAVLTKKLLLHKMYYARKEELNIRI